MNKKLAVNLWYALLAMLAVLWIQQWWRTDQMIDTIPYSQFEQLLKEQKIADLAIRPHSIAGKLKQPLADGRQYFVTARVDPQLATQLQPYHVTFTGVVPNTLLSDILSWVVPALVFVLIWMFFVRRFAARQGLGGVMNLGKSKAKVYVETDTKVGFDDVAGVEEAKEELREIVTFLKHPRDYGRLGARVPKGVLLVGPPGTGKTLLARAVAGEAGVPFFSISGSEFVEMFVGVGAARVRDLFEQARTAAPCIIFIDELDALGRARGVVPYAGGYDEKEQTLNQLLTELDGFDPKQGIVLLAATNRPEILDPALLRAGRFDRQVLVDRPDKQGRAAILQVHMKRIRAAADADPEKIAGLTPGFSGADLANLVNEAAIQATRHGAEAVTLADFTNAVERLVAGLEKKSRVLGPHEREVVAYHEMGHALVAIALPGVDPVHKISIIPRGVGALGYTLQRPTEDRFLLTRAELENKITVLLGGRAAERLVLGEVSTGAADDLDKATDIARHMVTRFGMSERLGQRTYDAQGPAFSGEGHVGGSTKHDYSDATAREIDRAVREMIDAAFDRASTILATYRAQLEQGAHRLLEKETLTREELPVLPQREPGRAAIWDASEASA